MSTARALTESEKKRVAARGGWRCSDCGMLLPPAYQVDHTVPLCDGGEDSISNCTAMCANCHADKTQRESIARRASSALKTCSYADRVDVFLSKDVVQCSLCFAIRPASLGHMVCTAIEVPAMRETALQHRLAEFSFAPRFALQGSKDVGLDKVHRDRRSVF